MPNFMEIHPVEAALIYADRRTDEEKDARIWSS